MLFYIVERLAYCKLFLLTWINIVVKRFWFFCPLPLRAPSLQAIAGDGICQTSLKSTGHSICRSRALRVLFIDRFDYELTTTQPCANREFATQERNESDGEDHAW